MLLYMLLNGIAPLKEDFNNFNDLDGIKKIYLYLNGYNPNFKYNYFIGDYISLAILYLLALSVSLYAAYLSFNCKSNISVDNMFIKICLAIIAFLLGPIYLLWYFIINYLGKGCS